MLKYFLARNLLPGNQQRLQEVDAPGHKIVVFTLWFLDELNQHDTTWKLVSFRGAGQSKTGCFPLFSIFRLVTYMAACHIYCI